jgi:uncharacterized protein YegJ (DUF2314 family)
MRSLFALVTLLLVHGLVFSQPTVEVSADDPQMVAAISRARQTVQRVITELERGNKQTSVKVAIVDGAAVEHFWLRDVEYDAKTGAFVGKIDNDPDKVKTVRLGQAVTVRAGTISDWLYMSGGKMHGNFTVRVLLPKMAPEEASRLRGLLSDDA